MMKMSMRKSTVIHILSFAAWISLGIIFVLFGYVPLRDSDTFMYLALARNFFAQGHFATSDPFIIPAPGTDWEIMHSWASYIFYYFGYVVAGFAGVTILKILIAAAAYAPSLRWMQRRERWFSPVQFAVFLVGLIAFSIRFSERASLIGDMCTVLTMAVLLGDWEGSKKMRWWLPVLAVVWANFHGSFPLLWVLGLIWLGAYVLIGEWRGALERAPALVASAFTPLLNPDGWNGVTYPFRFMTFKRQFLDGLTLEWLPTFSKGMVRFHETWFFLAFLILVALVMAWNLFEGFTKRKVLYFALFALLMVMALRANRFIPSAIMGLTLITAAVPFRREWRERKLTAAAMAFTGLAFIGVQWSGQYWHAGAPLRFGSGVETRVFPEEKTVQVLREAPPGNVWNSFYFGCFLAWVLEEKKPFMIHGFVSDVSLFQRFFSGIAISQKAFDEQAAKHGLTAVLAQKAPFSLPLINVLVEHTGWRVGSEDEVSILFLKR